MTGYAGRVVKDQQPIRGIGSKYRVSLRDRVASVQHIPDTELCCKITKPRCQRGRLIRRKLPYDSEFGQMTVRVFECHTGLPAPTQPAERHDLRSRLAICFQPGMQVRQQILSPGQEHWPR